MIYVEEVIKDLFLKEVCHKIPCGTQRCEGTAEWLDGCLRYRDFRDKIKKVIKETRDC